MANRYLTLEEAAHYLHVPPEKLAHMVKQQEIPFVQNAKRVAFDTDALDAWASQRILQMSERHLGDYHRGSSLDTRYRAGEFALVSSLFAPTHMVIDLPSRTKASVIRDLVAIAEKAELLYAPADLVRSLIEREAICSTGMAGGVALVHPRHHDPYLAPDSFCVLARTATPIPFGAPDGENTDVFFMICCLDERLHLHILARLCTMLNTTDLLTRIHAAEDAVALFAALDETEQAVLGRLQRER